MAKDIHPNEFVSAIDGVSREGTHGESLNTLAREIAVDKKRRALFVRQDWAHGGRWITESTPPWCASATRLKMERDGLVRRAGLDPSSTQRGSTRWVTAWAWTSAGHDLCHAIVAVLAEGGA